MNNTYKHTLSAFNNLLNQYHDGEENLFLPLDKNDLITAIEALNESMPRGTYQCFHCGAYTVVWGADFSFEDYGYEGEGIIHSCSCVNCGAQIEYMIDLNDDGNDEIYE